MALEIAAAIIGILAAAGKVAETLGPVVSTFKDATRSIAAVLNEVNSSRVILSALHKYLDNLSSNPQSRRELIQIDQLIATLTDGVLLFSELEYLALPFARPVLSLQGRINWAWNGEKFAALVSRMQNFKSSITFLLNILQCESDMEAFGARNELLRLTSIILENNAELATRMARLEDYCTVSNAVNRRPDSLATTKRSMQHDSKARLGRTFDTISLAPSDTTALAGYSSRSFTSRDRPENASVLYSFEFERVLFSSRVYHRAKRETSDVSFRSSVGLSHALTAISDISLSDISNISLVALPLTLADVSNRQHYTFAPLTAPEPSASSKSFLRSPGDVSRDQSFDWLQLGLPSSGHNTFGPHHIDERMTSEAEPMAQLLPLPAVLDDRYSDSIILVIKGSTSYHRFVEKFATHAERFTDDGALRKIMPHNVSSTIETTSTTFKVQIIQDAPVPWGMTRAQMDRSQSERGNLFMLLYDINSKLSFERILNYHREVLEVNKGKRRRVCVVAVQCTPIRGHIVERGGTALAKALGARYVVVRLDDLESIDTALVDLIASHWETASQASDQESSKGSGASAISAQLFGIRYERVVLSSDDSSDPVSILPYPAWWEESSSKLTRNPDFPAVVQPKPLNWQSIQRLGKTEASNPGPAPPMSIHNHHTSLTSDYDSDEEGTESSRWNEGWPKPLSHAKSSTQSLHLEG